MNKDALRVWMIITSVLYGLTALLSLGGFIIIPMLFDAPGSEENTALLAFATCLIAYPFTCILAIVLGWVFLRTNKPRLCLLSSLLPILDGLVALAFLLASDF